MIETATVEVGDTEVEICETGDGFGVRPVSDDDGDGGRRFAIAPGVDEQPDEKVVRSGTVGGIIAPEGSEVSSGARQPPRDSERDGVSEGVDYIDSKWAWEWSDHEDYAHVSVEDLEDDWYSVDPDDWPTRYRIARGVRSHVAEKHPVAHDERLGGIGGIVAPADSAGGRYIDRAWSSHLNGQHGSDPSPTELYEIVAEAGLSD